MNTQLDVMLKALAKSVVSILDAPVSNRRALLQKTCTQFRKAAVDYIEGGLAKAYAAGEGSKLAKRYGRRLAKDHSEIQALASILAQTEDLLGRLARSSYDKPEMLNAVQAWMAEGTVLLSDMASGGAVGGEAMAPEPVIDDFDYADDVIEEEVEKFTRGLMRKLRKQADEEEDFDFDEEPDLDEDPEQLIDDEVEKFTRRLMRKMRKAVETPAEKIPGASGISDNDLDFDIDEDPDQDNPRDGDMVGVTPTEASQSPDDDEVTGVPDYTPDLEAAVEKFARNLARQVRKAVETPAEKIPDAGEESDNDLDFDIDEDPDQDNPRDGEMVGVTPTEASQSPDDDEVTGVPQYSPNLEAEVEKFARRLVRKMGQSELRKQGMPPQGGGQQAGGGPPQGAPMQGEDVQAQEIDLDSPEIIGRLSAAIFDEAAKLKGAGEQMDAPPQAPAAQGNAMGNEGFQKAQFQTALRKAAQNVLGELRKTPAPAKGVVRRVVSKADDATELAKSYGINLEDEAARLEKLDPEQRAAELIKFAHRNPRAVGG